MCRELDNMLELVSLDSGENNEEWEGFNYVSDDDDLGPLHWPIYILPLLSNVHTKSRK